MDQRYVSLSRTGYRVALLAGCVLLAPSAARAAPPHDVPGPVTVNSTSGNTVANWSAFLDEAGVSACAGPQVQGRMAATMSIAVSDALNAIAPRSPQIAFHGRELTASARPAVAAAASTSLVEVLRSIPGSRWIAVKQASPLWKDLPRRRWRLCQIGREPGSASYSARQRRTRRCLGPAGTRLSTTWFPCASPVLRPPSTV
jgi:hypothetical protein